MVIRQCPLKLDPSSVITAPICFFYTDTIERGANAVGMSIPPPATTEIVGGGGITLLLV